MKLAAMEGLYEGQTNAPLVGIGILGSIDETFTKDSKIDFAMKVEIPGALSFLASHDFNSFVPGIKDSHTLTHITTSRVHR